MRSRRLQLLEENPSEEPLVNLTPLIDVVFVVLISFMLIAPILDIDSVALAPSGPSSKKESPAVQNSSLSISIRVDNSIWFQGQRMNLETLEKHLLLEKKRRGIQTPQVIPDARSHFETYAQVKNVLEACGFEQMDIVLRPP
jgi:biopolymer transport protein ExbD